MRLGLRKLLVQHLFCTYTPWTTSDARIRESCLSHNGGYSSQLAIANCGCELGLGEVADSVHGTVSASNAHINPVGAAYQFKDFTVGPSLAPFPPPIRLLMYILVNDPVSPTLWSSRARGHDVIGVTATLQGVPSLKRPFLVIGNRHPAPVVVLVWVTTME
ncbi:hypothetical protein EDD15DRAFT_2403245 [Pisolithus albus]|nr:hypothetical protein EDD15DRAFT_2403245 [Pisolithus albus]